MVPSVEASTQRSTIIDTNLREVGDYEILGMQWYTLLAVGVITATGIALLIATEIPFEILKARFLLPMERSKIYDSKRNAPSSS